MSFEVTLASRSISTTTTGGVRTSGTTLPGARAQPGTTAISSTRQAAAASERQAESMAIILPDRHQARRRRSAALGLGEVEQHERPADGPELLVDAGAVAAAPAAPVRLRSLVVLTPLAHAPVEDHLHALVSG